MSIRVAFASNDRLHVNQHFGATEGFFIYDVELDKAQLVAVGEFPAAAMDGNETKLGAKIEFLAGCAAVFVMAVGGSAIQQLMAAGVQPVRVGSVHRIGDLLAEIQIGMREGGVPWIDKAIAVQRDPDRFAAMAGEAWTE
jgi:nitrogen fixation protein NifX